MANRLGFQFLALAPGVLALAGYFQDTFRIGTGFAAVCFPIRGYAVASGMCAFGRCSHGNSFCRACPSLRKKRVRWRNWVSALSECPYSPREHICRRPLCSVTPGETKRCPILLIMGRYQDVTNIPAAATIAAKVNQPRPRSSGGFVCSPKDPGQRGGCGGIRGWWVLCAVDTRQQSRGSTHLVTRRRPSRIWRDDSTPGKDNGPARHPHPASQDTPIVRRAGVGRPVEGAVVAGRTVYCRLDGRLAIWCCSTFAPPGG